MNSGVYKENNRRHREDMASAEAMKFKYPELYLDPMIRAAALIQMRKINEAKTAVKQLLKLKPDFKVRGRWLMSRYIKVDVIIDQIIDGLDKAGLKNIE